MLEAKARVIAYDPKAMDTARALLGDKIRYAESMYDALEGADVLVILTEWEEFRELDLKRVSPMMRHRKIIDSRNLLDRDKMKDSGFNYQRIGS